MSQERLVTSNNTVFSEPLHKYVCTTCIFKNILAVRHYETLHLFLGDIFVVQEAIKAIFVLIAALVVSLLRSQFLCVWIHKATYS